MADGVSLGTLSVALQANIDDFVSKIKEATSALQSFQKVAAQVGKGIASAAVFDPKAMLSNLSQLQSAVDETIKGINEKSSNIKPINLPQSGVMKQYITDVRDATSTLQKMAGSTEKANYSIRMLADGTLKASLSLRDATKAASKNVPGYQLVSGDTGKYFKEVEDQKSILQGIAGANKQVNASTKVTADGYLKSSYTIRDANQKISKSFGQTISEMLNFQSFMAKIIHYISFSIGVQLVMALRQGLSNTIETIKEFERTVVNTASVAGYLGGAFEDAKQSITNLSIELSKRTVYSANQLAAAFYNLASAGIDVVNMKLEEFLPIAQFAEATQIDLNTASELVVNTMKQFGLTLKDTEQIVDSFTTTITNTYATAEKLKESMKYVGSIAGELGQDIDTVNAALSVLYDRGLQGGEAGQRLNMILTKLLKPAEEGEKNLAALGLTISDLDPYSQDLTDILYKLRAANFDAADATSLFRARTAAAIVILVSEVDKIVELRKQIELTQGITASLAEKQMNTLWGSMEKLRNKIVETSIAFTGVFAPSLSYVADLISKNILGATKELATFLESVINILRVFKPILTPILSILLKLGPILLISYVSLRALAFILPKVGAGALVAASGITSAKIAISGLFSSLFIALIPLQLLSTIFPQIEGMMGPLTAAIILLTIATRIHSIAVAKEIALMAMHAAGSALLTATILIEAAIYRFWTAAVNLTTIAVYAQIAALTIWRTALTISGSLVKVVSILLGIFGISMGTYTVATTIATAATYAFAAAIVATGIGAIIVGIGLLIANFDKISYVVATAARSFTDFYGISQKELAINKEQVVELKKLKEAIYDVAKAEDYRAEKAKEIRDEENEGIKDTKLYIELTNQLKVAEKDVSTARIESLKIAQNVINQLKTTSGQLDKAATAYIDYQNALNRTNSAKTVDEELTKSQTKALDVYIEKVATFGSYSTEASDAFDQYRQISQQVARNAEELISLQAEENDKMNEAKDAANDLNDVDKERLEIIKNLTQVQRDMVDTIERRAELEADVARIESIVSNWQDILETQTRNLWEQKLKLLDAEEKLYKLRQSEPAILDEIFKALADEGLLNGEIIDDYKDLMQSQGDLTKDRIDYFQIISSLSSGERAIVEQAIENYKKLREQGVSVAEAFQQAFGGLDVQIPSLDLGEVSSLGQFAEDEYAVAEATKRLGEVLAPILDQMSEFGTLPAEVMSKWTEFLKLPGELADAEGEVTKANESVQKTTIDTISIFIALWQKAITSPSKLSDSMKKSILNMGGPLSFLLNTVDGIQGSFHRFISMLPAASSAVTSFGGPLAFMNQMFSNVDGVQMKARDSLSAYTEAEIITTAALVEMAAKQGITIGQYHNLSELSNALHLDKPFYDEVAAIDTLLPKKDDVVTSLGDIKTAIDTLSGVIGTDENTGFRKCIADLTTAIETFGKTGPEQVGKVKSSLEQLYDWLKGIDWGGLLRMGGFWITGESKVNSHKKGGIFSTPQLGLFGEAGAEALIPLEKNKTYGKDLLKYIIPRYYPELLGLQTGGLFGGGRTVTHTTGPTHIEEYRIYGPINITGVSNVNDFMNQLKLSARASKRY